MKKAVFFDKDGTLVEDVPYNVDPERIRLMPGVEPALRLLQEAGYEIHVISNQPGIALGRFSPAALGGVERKLRSLLGGFGVSLSGFYFCPHHPSGKVAEYAKACGCRKPEAGLLLQAAHEHGIDLQRSWMVGDILHDVEAGHRAGCRSILIENGNETDWKFSHLRFPDYMAPDLLHAAREIISFRLAPSLEPPSLLSEGRCA